MSIIEILLGHCVTSQDLLLRSSVCRDVSIEVALLGRSVWAQVTGVGLLPGVDPHVGKVVGLYSRSVATEGALMDDSSPPSGRLVVR